MTLVSSRSLYIKFWFTRRVQHPFALELLDETARTAEPRFDPQKLQKARIAARQIKPQSIAFVRQGTSIQASHLPSEPSLKMTSLCLR
jgi:hypothetical protein